MENWNGASNTVNVLFCGLENTICSKIREFDNSFIQTNGKFSFRWESNFVVQQTHENHKNQYPTINNFLTVVQHRNGNKDEPRS